MFSRIGLEMRYKYTNREEKVCTLLRGAKIGYTSWKWCNGFVGRFRWESSIAVPFVQCSMTTDLILPLVCSSTERLF